MPTTATTDERIRLLSTPLIDRKPSTSVPQQLIPSELLGVIAGFTPDDTRAFVNWLVLANSTRNDALAFTDKEKKIFEYEKFEYEYITYYLSLATVTLTFSSDNSQETPLLRDNVETETARYCEKKAAMLNAIKNEWDSHTFWARNWYIFIAMINVASILGFTAGVLLTKNAGEKDEYIPLLLLPIVSFMSLCFMKSCCCFCNMNLEVKSYKNGNEEHQSGKTARAHLGIAVSALQKLSILANNSRPLESQPDHRTVNVRP